MFISNINLDMNVHVKLHILQKVYVGSGVWLERDNWGSLLRAPNDSMFCRFAASSYWTPEQLRNRSVKGALSNRFRSFGRTVLKPQLTQDKVSSLKGVARFCTTFKCSVPYNAKQISSKPCGFIMCLVTATSWSKPFTRLLS